MTLLGTWNLSIASPMGTQHPTIAFTEEDGAIIGTMTSPTGLSGAVDNLVVDGDSATWKANVVSPMGPVNLAFAATANGDALTGKVTTPMGSIDLSGVRQA